MANKKKSDKKGASEERKDDNSRDSGRLKGFGDLLGESFKEYKTNFKTYFYLIALLSLLPSIIVFIISLVYYPSSFTLKSSQELINLMSATNFEVFVSVATIINFFIGVLLFSSLIYNSLYKKKTRMSLKESLLGGKNFYINYLGLSLVLLISLSLLYMALIIPGIIFSVFWLFSAYYLIGEEKGIINSLKRSFNTVRKKWWRTFGFLILFVLIAIGINLLFNLIGAIINLIISIPIIPEIIKGAEVSQPYYMMILKAIVKIITSFCSTIVVYPLGILFVKNLYKDMKEDK